MGRKGFWLLSASVLIGFGRLAVAQSPSGRPTTTRRRSRGREGDRTQADTLLYNTAEHAPATWMPRSSSFGMRERSTPPPTTCSGDFAGAALWVAEVAHPDSQHEALAQEGSDAAQRAVAVRPDGPEALYFGALDVGEISHAVGFVTALFRGLERKFRDQLLEVRDRTDHQQRHTLRRLGAVQVRIARPKRDLDASVKYLRRAGSRSGESPGARVPCGNASEARP